MSVSFRHIRYFLAAAEAGQISRAAIDLGVSQSAVTAAVKDLEQRVGTKLFERHAQGVSLTLEGSRFVGHARNIVTSVNEALRLEKDSAREVTGKVRVGVTYTVAGYFLPQQLARFSRSFPGVTVELREAPRASIEEDLVAGRLDTAVLLTSNIETRDRLDKETLIRSRRRLWLPLDHPLQQAEQIDLADLVEEPYVMLTVDEAAQTAGRYWERANLTPRVIFETSSVEAVRSLVANGMGITILSDMVYRPWSLEGQRIETRQVTEPIPSMDVGLAWARGADLSPATRAFRDHLSLTFNGAGHSLAT
ncbi:LysR family transcriptional regulator [Algihabitans albus]|uniref:LysR family transcriptional regulator n=1 Tax=Algihabitans albus TaxID=2164067 RepID=UPI000E5D21D1|nr:LysR family transcriptional regulator [Algihabitans albus]